MTHFRAKRPRFSEAVAERSPACTSSLDRLPNELLELILVHLSAPDVEAVSSCSRHLRDVALSDGVWHQMYETKFPRGRRTPGELSWHRVYMRASRSLKAVEQLDGPSSLRNTNFGSRIRHRHWRLVWVIINQSSSINHPHQSSIIQSSSSLSWVERPDS
eukprot:TRINITY_DN3786_c0_g1_i2.p1 TRINITY_DN3786_c0_g1~~TRINITY_DN3786_c0_g1_i2.p1  ORF type:complete len:160 (-),score=10.29 TRINITY_DN3786_c0_g1_i2:40-519(-)